MAWDGTSGAGTSTPPKGQGKGKGPPAPPKVSKPQSLSSTLSDVALKVRAGPLQAVPYTIETSTNGTRKMVLRDGTTKELPRDWCDSRGRWMVLHERAWMGFEDAEPAPEETQQEEPTETICEDPEVALRKLVAEHPELAGSAQAFLDGAPLNALRARLRGQFGAGLTAAFLKAVGASSESAGAPAVPNELQGEPSVMHGRLGDPSWKPPRLHKQCAEIARPGYNSCAAHEYIDDEEVLLKKVSLLAELIRKSRRFVVYAGAGLSTASGIADYATHHAKSVVDAAAAKALAKPVSPYSAKPNYGHRAFAALAKSGFLWRLVQQNHDGLPQKAGMAQKVLNEIHGAWFDPSNPVVPMSGQLRGDLFSDLQRCEREADLVLAVGTSLCGMNADCLVSTCAERSRSSEAVHGSVIISLQRTPHDAASSVRIFAPIDHVMELLATKMSLHVESPDVKLPEVSPDCMPLGKDIDVFAVPYDDEGRMTKDGKHRRWDLRDGAEHIITMGPDKGSSAVILGKNADGHYRVGIRRENVAGRGEWKEVRLLGRWWVNGAVAGEVAALPVVEIAQNEVDAIPVADVSQSGTHTSSSRCRSQ